MCANIDFYIIVLSIFWNDNWNIIFSNDDSWNVIIVFLNQSNARTIRATKMIQFMKNFILHLNVDEITSLMHNISNHVKMTTITLTVHIIKFWLQFQISKNEWFFSLKATVAF